MKRHEIENPGNPRVRATSRHCMALHRISGRVDTKRTQNEGLPHAVEWTQTLDPYTARVATAAIITLYRSGRARSSDPGTPQAGRQDLADIPPSVQISRRGVPYQAGSLPANPASGFTDGMSTPT